MPKVVHFEINADDPLRAKKFYEDVFPQNQNIKSGKPSEIFQLRW